MDAPKQGLTARWLMPEDRQEAPSVAVARSNAPPADNASEPKALSTDPPPATSAQPGTSQAHTKLTNAPPAPECAAPDPPAPGSPLIDRIMWARGIHGEEARDAFLNGSLNDIPTPETLPGCTQAANRILQAIEAGEAITIYGDFDADGITSTAILWHTLRTIDPKVDLEWYIPHRLEEGYGLQPEAMQKFADDGRQLIISVDCGVTAVDEAALAADLGLELIITDHHQIPPDGQLPQACAIVHPSLPGQQAPFGELAGAGVAWKLAWQVARLYEGADRLGPQLKAAILDGLSLAAMGTVADMMPLVEENRPLVRVGLRHMPQCGNHGVQALLEACTKPGERVSPETIGFKIGPRVNAAGRLGHAAEAVELFTTAGPEQARVLAGSLSTKNETRQDLVAKLQAEAEQAAIDAGMTEPDRRIIVLAGDSDTWHRGVLGIACARLSQKYGRPTILLQRVGNQLSGSSRGVRDVSILAALQHCSDLLDSHGGHHMAAGLSLQDESLEPFIERITKWVNAHLLEAHLVPGIDVDCEADANDLNMASIRALDVMQPFGRGNPTPCVLVRDALVQQPKYLGKTGLHLECTLDVQGTKINAVWWRGAEHFDHLIEGTRIDVVAEPIIDTWSKARPRLVIRDIRSAG
ncbi:MAG: single-stranded-DNA-specific exonuclease RecJ [Phycisphaerales bacterium]|nr:single-stranded-DNA-specific exonuclease RecJ [Phycisphaerales bacterium]